MPTQAPPWQLMLAGVPTLSAGTAHELTGRTAALTTYLALEGPQTRLIMTRLLWPGTPTAAARNNLVQLLRRLNSLAPSPVVVGQEAISLHHDGQVRVPDDSAAELLGALEFDQLPEFDDWLRAQRVRQEERRQAAQAAQLGHAAGHPHAAALAQARFEAEPWSEDACRHLMMLHHQHSDRAAALRTYQRFEERLWKELEARPSAELQQLARDVASGHVRPAAPAERQVPLSVLRPPQLRGRDALWSEMETAWAAGQGIALMGAAGSGKTRLALDFIRSRAGGGVLLFQGRPGDSDVPYATHTRTFRQTFTAFPELRTQLEPWVLRELSRMLPELGDPPGPLESDADKLRFYDAKVEVLRRQAEHGLLVLFSDDVQYMDDASVEAGSYVYAQLLGTAGAQLRAVFSYRAGELSPNTAQLAEQLFAGQVVRPVPVAPLTTEGVAELLSDLDVPDSVALAPILQQVTQGLPQRTLEIVRHLHSRGDFSPAAVRDAAATGFAPLVAERLSRLSPVAVQVARAAAVLGADFTPEVVAELLRTHLVEVMLAWEELEAAQILVGEAFSHDLVAEAVLEQTPEPVRHLLHRAAARLDARGVSAARIARHWVQGQEPAEAARWFERAASYAQGAQQPQQAQRLRSEAETYRNA